MARSVFAIASLLLLACASVQAVSPATWAHSTEADFAAGKLEKTVLSSLGELMLARSLETLVQPREDLGMISAVAIDGQGRLHAAVSPGGKIFRVLEGKLVEFAELPGVLVRALVFADGDLIAGVSGKQAGIYRIDAGGKVQRVWTDPSVKFVWAVLPGPRGTFYAATGPEGKVYQIRPDGKATAVYDGDEKNILSLAADGDGMLYAGTGENGLVLVIDPARRSGRILYDAPEKEISAVLIGREGLLYAATSDSTLASATGEAPSPEEKGKPEPAAPTRPAGPEGRAGPPALVPPVAGSSVAEASAAKPVASRPAARTRPSEVTTRAAARPAAPQPTVRKMPAAPSRPARPSAPPAKPPGKGNAVYRIDKEGFVRAIFRRPVTILAMAMHGGELTLATGHGGEVFAVGADEDRVTMLAKVDPKDVTAMVAGPEGRLYLGTADQAGLFAIGGGFAGKGTYISKVLDAKQISRWGTFSVLADVPGACKATIATRSGNVAEPDEKTWSQWSAERPLERSWQPISSPAGRFLQYRLTLTSDGKSTPVVDHVRLVYQADNLPPSISAVQIVPNYKPARPGRGETPTQPLRYRIITTKAADPNKDDLEYAVFFRRLGNSKWIKLTEKVTAPLYVWDTLGVGDGTYELRVEVSDARANPPKSALTSVRISRPVVVDNSPPQVTDLVVKPAGKGKVSLAGKVADMTSRIASIAYAVDTNEDWTAILAADGICDSLRESFSATAEELAAGRHRIALRVTDEFNNSGYASMEVTVGE